MNLDLKIALIRNFGSQVRASRRLRIAENKLSYIVQGHSEPNEHEREVLRKALGQDFFATEEKESQADERRGPMEILADQSGCTTYGAKPKKD